MRKAKKITTPAALAQVASDTYRPAGGWVILSADIEKTKNASFLKPFKKEAKNTGGELVIKCYAFPRKKDAPAIRYGSDIAVHYASPLITKILKAGGQVQGGVMLMTASDLIADQATWGDMDASKDTDFTTSPFWLVTDDGQDPIGIDTDDDLLREVDL